jgi:hypothetical protein
VSFDPQNPRGTAPLSTPPPGASKPPGYIPPQPVKPSPSRNVWLVIGGVVALVLLALAVLLLVNNRAGSTASPSRPPNASAAPSPAGASGPLPSAPRTALPTSGSGSGIPTLASSPGTAETELLSHIPEALRATCTTMTAASSPGIEMASCSASSGAIAVNYSQYATAEIMNAAYEEIFAPLQIDPNTGSCEDHPTWPAESDYDVEGTPVGRRLCTDEQGAPTIYWTDERLNILSHASGPDATQLLDFWTNEAGPAP